MSYRSLWAILREDLKMHPYRIQLKHKLTPQDKICRVCMCRWFQQMVADNPDWLDNVWFTEESHFHLSGHVNSKSWVCWGTSPPDEVYQTPLHSSQNVLLLWP